MEALRSSTKRPHSATPPPENVVRVDGACLRKPEGASTGDTAPPAKAAKASGAATTIDLKADDKSAIPTMPKFLQLESACQCIMTLLCIFIVY